MKKLLFGLMAFLTFLSYRVNVKFYPRQEYEDKNYVYMDWGHRPRWYSPLYWAWVALRFIYHLFSGGAIEWADNVWNDFHEARWHTRSFCWKENVSKWRKARAYFHIFYYPD